MLRFSKKIDHALLALQDLASEGRPASSVFARSHRIDRRSKLLAKDQSFSSDSLEKR